VKPHAGALGHSAQGSFLKAVIYLTIVSALLTPGVRAQQPAEIHDDPSPSAEPAAASLSAKPPHPNEKNFLRNLAIDQKNIWTSPAHVTRDDLTWLVPSAGIATGLFVTDPSSSSGMASYHANAWKDVSNYGLGAALGISGGTSQITIVHGRLGCWPQKP